MFSRNVPPIHCVNGSDSMGRHVSGELMASSARRGVMSVPACMVWKNRGGVDPPRPASRCVCGLISFQLFIETSNHRLQFIDRGIILLRQHLFLLQSLLFIVG